MAKVTEVAVAVAAGKGAYSMKDAARYVGVSLRTMYALIKLKDGPKSFTIGARRLISRDELDRFIRAKCSAA